MILIIAVNYQLGRQNNMTPREINFRSEDYDIWEDISTEELSVKFKDTHMENGILKLDKENIKSALVYGLVFGLGAVLLYMLKVGTVFALNWHMMVDAFVFGIIGSLVKNLFTTNDGKFLGMVNTVSTPN